MPHVGCGAVRIRPALFPGQRSMKASKAGISFILCYSIFVLLVIVCFCYVVFSFFNTKPRDWLRRTSPRWPVLCQVGTQYWLLFIDTLAPCRPRVVRIWPSCFWARRHTGWLNPVLVFLFSLPPFPQIDIIGAMVIVWRVRAKIIRSVLCNIVCNNCAQCDAHTYEQT